MKKPRREAGFFHSDLGDHSRLREHFALIRAYLPACSLNKAPTTAGYPLCLFDVGPDGRQLIENIGRVVFYQAVFEG